MNRAFKWGLIAASAGALAFILHATITSVRKDAGPFGYTRGRLNFLKTGLLLYREEYGQFPASSENKAICIALAKGNPRKLSFISFGESELNAAQEVIDGWNRPYRFAFAPDDSAAITSAGEDGVFGTRDDIKAAVNLTNYPHPIN